MDAHLGVNGVDDEVIKAAVFESTKDREDPKQLFVDKSPSQVFVAFPGSWSPDDWFAKEGEAGPFGETKIDNENFPSLRSLGNNVPAMVNAGFRKRFLELLKDNSDGAFRNEVKNAVEGKKQIIFTGHSSGGPIAIYATVWFLEKYGRQEGTPRPLCLTFGSPLATDRTFCHAIRREGWSDCFLHFVMKVDIVPRILLAPLSSTKESLEKILPFFNPHHELDSIDKEQMKSLYKDVMKNASCVANYAACALTGGKHSLSDTMSRFIKLSPYRPCGTYVFCTETGRLVVVKNPDAVLQLLYYTSLQIEPKTEPQKKAVASLEAHRRYKDAIDKSLATHDVVCLYNLRELPLSSDDAVLKELNLCAPARLCLRAAGELEKKKLDNQDRIEGKKGEIKNALDALERYRTASKDDMGYYDSFKLHQKEGDFKANVVRLELTAIWEDIIQMVRQRELPDGFEIKQAWVELGKRFRRLVEPIDIANYYRHGRDYVSGPYLEKGRPSMYRYTQRWREHAKRSPKVSHCKSEQSQQLPKVSYCESSFWAEVEELRKKAWEEEKVEDRVLVLGKHLENWYENKEDKEVESDVFLKGSTLYVWWQALRKDHAEPRSLLLGPMPLVE